MPAWASRISAGLFRPRTPKARPGTPVCPQNPGCPVLVHLAHVYWDTSRRPRTPPAASWDARRPRTPDGVPGRRASQDTASRVLGRPGASQDTPSTVLGQSMSQDARAVLGRPVCQDASPCVLGRPSMSQDTRCVLTPSVTQHTPPVCWHTGCLPGCRVGVLGHRPVSRDTSPGVLARIARSHAGTPPGCPRTLGVLHVGRREVHRWHAPSSLYRKSGDGSGGGGEAAVEWWWRLRRFVLRRQRCRTHARFNQLVASQKASLR